MELCTASEKGADGLDVIRSQLIMPPP